MFYRFFLQKISYRRVFNSCKSPVFMPRRYYIQGVMGLFAFVRIGTSASCIVKMVSESFFDLLRSSSR